jgi:putative membrane protein
MIAPGERVRCHPSVIVENSFSLLVLIALLVTRFETTAIGGVLAAAVVALLLYNYRQWNLTTIRFNETEIVVERDTLFKMKKTLPYAKIASVNVNRGIVNRLFGTARLQININSGSTALVPEAVLTFREDVADELRSVIQERLHDGEPLPDEEEPAESLASFSPADVIVHGLFSVPTYQTIFGSVFLAYSVFELYTSAGAGIGGAAERLSPC